jgi:hypothetical protein
MIAWKPDLSELGRRFVLGEAFPDSWREWSTCFIQGECLKGMLYPIR